jgi:hypothetical protein
MLVFEQMKQLREFVRKHEEEVIDFEQKLMHQQNELFKINKLKK